METAITGYIQLTREKKWIKEREVTRPSRKIELSRVQTVLLSCEAIASFMYG